MKQVVISAQRIDKLYKILCMVCIVVNTSSFAFSQTNKLDPTGKAGVGINAPSKALHILNHPENDWDATIRLSQGITFTDPQAPSGTPSDIRWGHLSILGSNTLATYTSGGVLGDVVLQASTTANNLVLTTRNNTGRIALSTTPTLLGNDEERLVVLPDGRIAMGRQLKCPNTPSNNYGVFPIHDVTIRSTLALGNPHPQPNNQAGSCGQAGVLTFFPNNGASWFQVRNDNGVLKTGLPIMQSNLQTGTSRLSIIE